MKITLPWCSRTFEMAPMYDRETTGKRGEKAYKLITRRQELESATGWGADGKRGREWSEPREETGCARAHTQLEESKYNYTKVSRNTETESRGNRRVSLKLESCFETTRLPCRLQPRHRRALPFPNSGPSLSASSLRALLSSCCSAVPWKVETKRNFSCTAFRRLLRKNYVSYNDAQPFLQFAEIIAFIENIVKYEVSFVRSEIKLQFRELKKR